MMCTLSLLALESVYSHFGRAPAQNVKPAPSWTTLLGTKSLASVGSDWEFAAGLLGDTFLERPSIAERFRFQSLGEGTSAVFLIWIVNSTA